MKINRLYGNITSIAKHSRELLALRVGYGSLKIKGKFTLNPRYHCLDCAEPTQNCLTLYEHHARSSRHSYTVNVRVASALFTNKDISKLSMFKQEVSCKQSNNASSQVILISMAMKWDGCTVNYVTSRNDNTLQQTTTKGGIPSHCRHYFSKADLPGGRYNVTLDFDCLLTSAVRKRWSYLFLTLDNRIL